MSLHNPRPQRAALSEPLHSVNPPPRQRPTPSKRTRAGTEVKPVKTATAPTEKTSANGQPRYLQVAAELTRAIAQGRYPVGARLPTELELCERYAISRFTAREAVRVLSTAGLITRRQRAGTVVIATPDEARYTHDASSLRDLLQYALDTELRLLYIGKVALDKDRAREFAATPGAEWVYAIGIRVETSSAGSPEAKGAALAAARPICVTRLFLNPSLAGIEARLRERRSAVYALIEREYKVTIQRVEQDLQATLLDADDAANLGAAPGAPALRIVRRYYDADDRLLEVAENVHPADRFTYRMHLRK
jgi:GntR family transcriptional regulator